MEKKGKDYFSTNTLIKQIILIVVIGSITIFLAAMLPWLLNKINPPSMPTALSSLPAQVGVFDIRHASATSGLVETSPSYVF
ncbi:MAG: hypothetical protein H7Y59_01045 [Anaerolineales bacterium]|nr:hypothetical protein [Anaerolineales bacterium]